MDKYTENRPWGKFDQFCLNEPVTVKFLYVNPNERLSYQYHDQRSEFWKVVKGSGQVVLNDETLEAKIGDEFEISVGTKHRIIANDEGITILEISFRHFDENDNHRVEDKYGRV